MAKNLVQFYVSYPVMLAHDFAGLVLRNEYNSYNDEATQPETEDCPEGMEYNSSEDGYRTDIEEEIFFESTDDAEWEFCDNEIQNDGE